MVKLRLQKLLFGLVFMNTLPHAFDLPMWVTLSAACLLVWRALSLWTKTRGATRWVRTSLVFLFTIVIFSEYGTLMGPDAATPLFVFQSATRILSVCENTCGKCPLVS